jgi:hypothetical protein
LTALCLLAGCSTSGSTGNQTGTVAGTVSSTLGGALGSVTVTVTPAGQTALASVVTETNGSYSVSNVPGGGGTVAVATVPTNCQIPAASSYSGVNGNTQTVNIQVTCQATGTLIGTVTSSATNAGISGASVTVTPTGAAALPSVATNSSGQYSVPTVPVGSGTIGLSNLPTGCVAPSPGNYTLTNPTSNLININVTCSPSIVGTTTLAVGQSALFASSPAFATNLTIAANGVYMMAVVNTDASESSTEDFSLSGTFTTSGPSHVAPRPPQKLRVQRQARHATPAGPLLDPRLARDLRYLEAAERGHVAYMERQAEYFRHLRGVTRAPMSASGAPVISKSLVNTHVGDVNTISVPLPSDNSPTIIGARTVYSGQHVQIVADTSLTNWPAQYRPDSSWYASFGQEYDTLTYAKHMLTYIGDPLAYDATQLSGVGKVTIVLTPVLNGQGSGVSGGGMVLAFVDGCDLVKNACPTSNLTEMIYHLVPNANFSVNFWEREIRPTMAHESKHIVSITNRWYQGGGNLEEVWLEEGLAQISSEIWGRNYNAATWRGNAGFAETLGCEVTGYLAACNTPTSPYTFYGSHMAWLHQYLQGLDSIPETLDGTTPGRYGAGWSLARWTIDLFANGSSPAAEGSMVQSLINNYSYQGIANLSNIAGVSQQTVLLDWSLAVALDTVSLLDSSTFIAADPKNTIPSFDLRNVFSVAGNGGLYGPAAPVRAALFTAGPINSGASPGVPGSEAFYVEIVSATAGTQSLQLLTGSGGSISPSSGLRVAIIRIQ